MKKKIAKSMPVERFEEVLYNMDDIKKQEKAAIEEQYWQAIEKEASSIVENEGKGGQLDPKAVIASAQENLLSKSPLHRTLQLCEAAICRATEIVEDYTAENTKRAYEGDLRYWEAWRKANGIQSDEQYKKEHIILFILQHIELMPGDIDDWLVSKGYKAKKGPHRLSTIKRRLVSLSRHLQMKKQPNPISDADIGTFLQTLTKKHGKGKAWHTALTKDFLNDILETFQEDTLIDKRDAALIFFGFSSGGRRRSEISSARFEDLKSVGDGYTYTIPKSKTDQAGDGREVPILGRAAILLRNWLNAGNIKDGFIFRSVTKGNMVQEKRLSDIDVNRIVKKRAKMAGYDESQFGAHSLRSGFVTESGRQNKPLGDTMALSGHNNVPTVMGYYQAGNVINNSAARLVD